MINTTIAGPFQDQDLILRSLIASAGQAIIGTDNHGNVTVWNHAAEKLFGYTSVEAIGKKITEFLEPACATKLITAAKTISSSTEILSIELSCRNKNMEVTDISITLSTLNDPDMNHVGWCGIVKNISSSKRDEEELQSSKANLNAIFENAQEGFVLLDTDFRIKLFNSRAKESIVLNRADQDPYIGQSIFEHVDEDRQEKFREIVNSVLAGTRVHYDRQYKDAAGKEYWFSFSLNPVKVLDRITGICITGINITNRKLAEKSLESNEKRFRAIVENSADAVTILTPEGQPTYISPSIKLVLGYTEEEAMKLNLFDLTHPDDKVELDRLWAKVLTSPGIPIRAYPCRLLHKNGTWRSLDGTITNLLHDPAIRGIVDNFRDITDKLDSEKQLKFSEERYRHLFYNNPLPMWIYDPETLKFLDVNNATVLNYGYSREELMEMTLLDIRPKEDRQKIIDAVSQRKNNDFNDGGTWEHVSKTGEIKHVEITSHRLNDEAESRILVLANDITEQKKAAQMLLKSYRDNYNILESITDAFYAVDREYRVVYWNKEAEVILGKRRSEMLGKILWEEYDKETASSFYDAYQQAFRENSSVKFEAYYAPLSMWVDVTAYPSEEGLSVYFKDITDTKIAIDKIKSANQQFEMVAKVTNDAIYEWDIQSNLNTWGEGYETLFGHKRTADKMSSDTWLNNLHPDERDDLLGTMSKALAERQTSLKREIRFRCADGTYKTVFDKLVIVYDEAGKPLKVMGAMQDITQRKKHEMAIVELNDQLNKRADELIKSNDELERFAYVASHDLQEPLRMVGSFLQLLKRKYSEQLDETALQYISYAVDGSERMKTLILDLLEYSRVGTNNDLETAVSMNKVMGTVLKTFADRIKDRCAVISVGELPTVMVNSFQITQLMQNLVSNALKYNEAEIPVVTINCEEQDEYWKFTVADNGLGIEEKFFEKVFVIFQRLHNKNKYSGTGIGLAICKKIVERHGGRIWIESEAGKGTSFLFTIKK